MSFEDKVTPATDVGLSVATPSNIRSARILTADAEGTSGPLKFLSVGAGDHGMVETKIPRLDISAIVVMEP